MTRVRFLVSAAGDEFAAQPGEIVDLPDEAARAWADGVRAELAESPRHQAVETATAARRETAVRRPSRRRR